MDKYIYVLVRKDSRFFTAPGVAAVRHSNIMFGYCKCISLISIIVFK